MAYSIVELEFQFQDKTTKKFQIGPFATSAAAISSMKNNVKAFNEKYGLSPDMSMEHPARASWYSLITNENGSPLMFSDDGAYPNVPILNATVITRQETDINLYD